MNRSHQFVKGYCYYIPSLDRNADSAGCQAMEASLEWKAANDMAAVLAVQVRRRVGLGIWTTLHLSKLQLEGKVFISIFSLT